MQSIESIAQQMYDAFGSVTDERNQLALPRAAWETLSPEMQGAWIAAAEKARDLLATEVVAPS